MAERYKTYCQEAQQRNNQPNTNFIPFGASFISGRVFLAFSWFEHLQFVIFGFIKFKHLETFQNKHVGPVKRGKCLKSVTYFDI